MIFDIAVSASNYSAMDIGMKSGVSCNRKISEIVIETIQFIYFIAMKPAYHIDTIRNINQY